MGFPLESNFYFLEYDNPTGCYQQVSQIGFGILLNSKRRKVEFWSLRKEYSFNESFVDRGGLILDVDFDFREEPGTLRIYDLSHKGRGTFIFNTFLNMVENICPTELIVSGTLDMESTGLKNRVQFWNSFGLNILEKGRDYKFRTVLGSCKKVPHRVTGNKYFSEIGAFKNCNGEVLSFALIKEVVYGSQD